MNEEKLKKMESQVRIGGKGTPRRKKKVMRTTAAADNRKLQCGLKKLKLTTLSAIDEVNMFLDDNNTVIHFNNPRVQASLASNTYTITGNGQQKQMVDLMPGILEQLDADKLNQMKAKHSQMMNQLLTDNDGDTTDDEVPEDYDEIPDSVLVNVVDAEKLE